MPTTSVTPTHEAVVPSSCATCLANAGTYAIANQLEEPPVSANAPLLAYAYLDKDRGVVQAVSPSSKLSGTLSWLERGKKWEWVRNQAEKFNGRLVVLPKMPFDELCSA